MFARYRITQSTEQLLEHLLLDLLDRTTTCTEITRRALLDRKTSRRVEPDSQSHRQYTRGGTSATRSPDQVVSSTSRVATGRNLGNLKLELKLALSAEIARKRAPCGGLARAS